MRVAFEEANTRPGSGRSALFRAAAPAPGTLRFSGQSQLSEAFSSMSLDSFPPEEATGVEMAVFPWAEKRSGLTGFGALIMLLIIATEPAEHGTGRDHAPSYPPLHTMTIVKRKSTEGKRGKKVHTTKTYYKSILNGKIYNHAPAFVNKVESLDDEVEEDDYSE
jgi:hypothetical protein